MWQWVARGNIQQIHSPDGTAFALWAHAAPSGECNCYVCVCTYVCVCVSMCVCVCVCRRVLGGCERKKIRGTSPLPKKAKLAPLLLLPQVLLYDLRSPRPYLVKDHNYGLPIHSLAFQRADDYVLSSDNRSVKIWHANNVRLFVYVLHNSSWFCVCSRWDGCLCLGTAVQWCVMCACRVSFWRKGNEILLLLLFLDSIFSPLCSNANASESVVRASDQHSEDPGSIPGWNLNFSKQICILSSLTSPCSPPSVLILLSRVQHSQPLSQSRTSMLSATSQRQDSSFLPPPTPRC